MAFAPSSGAGMSLNAPPNDPTGVRTALTMTACSIARPSLGSVVASKSHPQGRKPHPQATPSAPGRARGIRVRRDVHADEGTPAIQHIVLAEMEPHIHRGADPLPRSSSTPSTCSNEIDGVESPHHPRLRVNHEHGDTHAPIAGYGRRPWPATSSTRCATRTCASISRRSSRTGSRSTSPSILALRAEPSGLGVRREHRDGHPPDDLEVRATAESGPTLGEIIRRQRELSAMSMRRVRGPLGISNLGTCHRSSAGCASRRRRCWTRSPRNLDVSADVLDQQAGMDRRAGEAEASGDAHGGPRGPAAQRAAAPGAARGRRRVRGRPPGRRRRRPGDSDGRGEEGTAREGAAARPGGTAAAGEEGLGVVRRGRCSSGPPWKLGVSKPLSPKEDTDAAAR